MMVILIDTEEFYMWNDYISPRKEEFSTVISCESLFLFKLIILFCIDRLTPFAFGVFTRNLDGEVREPAGRSCAVPMLNAGGDVDYITGVQLASRLAPFLIVAAATGNEQNLAAAFVCVVNMPIIAAAGFKGYIANDNLVEREHVEIALANKILGVGVVFSACGKDS